MGSILTSQFDHFGTQDVWIIAGVTAALLTYFDLDRTFYIPSKTREKFQLYAWLLGFPLTNGLLAITFYFAFADNPMIKPMSPWLRSLSIGFGYLAFVRLKISTLEVGNEEIPLGPELFYETARNFVYRRINRIAKNARYEETTALASALSLGELARRAKLSIDQDALLNAQEKAEARQWVSKILEDPKTNEEDKRLTLADYILSERRSA